MKQRTYEGLKFLTDVTLVALFVVWAVLWVKDAQAGGDKITQHQEQSATINQSTSQSVNVSNTSDALATNDNVQSVTNEGDRFDSWALGLSNTVGAAAIADCLATNQLALLSLYAKQGTELNYWCAALWYDQSGMHDMAARARCQMKDIRRMFPKGKTGDVECRAENKVPLETLSTQDETYSQLSIIPELQSIIREQQAAQSASEERIANLEAEIEKARKRAQRPQAKPQTIIKQETFLDDKKREALAAIRGDR